jgi:hypothetical protein
VKESDQQNTTINELEAYLADRLISNAEDENANTDRGVLEEIDADSTTNNDELIKTTTKHISYNPTDTKNETLPVATDLKTITPRFTKVEKSLASLGFFTPSSRRIKNKEVKRISFTREVDGKRVEATAEIIPSVLYGLPITADQDKYLALQELITNILARDGQIKNPIRFRSADLIRLMNRNTKAGKNYKEIEAWLDVMFSTSIISSGTVYKSGEKRFARDRFRVFDRAVSVGKELDDGTIADANYVWLSQWQLENINNNYLLPVDIKTYRELKNHIAKALVPLLQIWLFASRKAGSFEKRYSELCEILNLQTYSAPSEIRRQLQPSLDELTRYEYLEKWRIEKTVDHKTYKIIFFHGPKFHRDRRKRIEQKNQAQSVVIAESETDGPDLPIPGRLEQVDQPSAAESKAPQSQQRAPQATIPTVPEPEREGCDESEKMIIAELISRSVFEKSAREILKSFPADKREGIYDYIDYWDSITAEKTPGLLIWFIESKSAIPTTFETRRQKKKRLAAEDSARTTNLIEETLSKRYKQYRQNAVDEYISEYLTIGEFERRVSTLKAIISEQKVFSDKQIRPELAEQIARSSVRDEVTKNVPTLSLEEFRNRELPTVFADLKQLPPEPPKEPIGFTPR